MVRNIEAEVRTRLVQPPPHILATSLGTLETEVGEAVGQKAGAVVLDMSRVQSIDSAGLNWLLGVQTRLAGQGIQLLLQDASEICMDIFVATRLEQRFKLTCSAGQELRHA